MSKKRSFFAAIKELFTGKKAEAPAGPERPVRKDPGEPICGGTTDRTDVNAPKKIESKIITALYMRFFQNNRWTADECHQFEFLIGPDDQGVLTAFERVSGFRCPADASLLEKLQKIVEEEGLAALNGLNRVTAGLAPECQPCEVSIDYESGEKLAFILNNNPFALWSERVYDVFADWFGNAGVNGFLPEPETSPVVRVRTEFNENGLLLRYGGMNVGEEKAINKETYLFRRIVYDVAGRKNLSGKYTPFPGDFGERVSAILAEYAFTRRCDFSSYDHEANNYGNHEKGYYGFGPGNEADAEDLGVSLYVEYADGRRFNVNTRKGGEIDGMKPMLTALFTYYDSLFD